MSRSALLRTAMAAAVAAIALSANAQLAPAEREALVSLYDSAGGPGWTNQANWLTGDPCADGWFGVSCMGEHVTEIHLSGNQLSGTLPDLSAFTALQKMNVSDNQLTGPLTTLESLPALVGFWGSNNQFTGFLPDVSGSHGLEIFWVMNNELIGPIPPGISGMTALQDFRVSTNKLTGTPPQAPAGLNAGGSSLCPNYLHAPSPSDAQWNAATGELDWSRWCTPGYLITASAGPGGSISPAGRAVLEGETAVFTVTPDTGYAVDGVTGSCGGSLTESTFTTDPQPSQDCTVTATFRALPAAAAPTPVPLLGEWTLALLGALAAALGVRRLQRR